MSPGRARWVGLAACAVAAVVGLTACTPLLAIDQRALVLALALDKGDCPGGIRATAQWYNSTPRLMISGGMGPETETACGDTVDGAITALRGHAHRNIDFGVTGVVLVGDGLAKEQIGPSMDLVWRDGELPESAQLAVVDGLAADLLIPAHLENGFRLYARLLDSMRSNTGSTPIPLWRFDQRRFGLPGDAWAPILAKTPRGIRDAGVGVFSAGRMVGRLDGTQASAFGWLTKLGGFSDLSLTLPGAPREQVALRIVSRQLGRSCDHGDPVLTLRLLGRVRAGDLVRLRGRDVAPLQQAAARAAYREVASALATLLSVGSDPVGLRTFGCRPEDGTRITRRVHLVLTMSVAPDEREA